MHIFFNVNGTRVFERGTTLSKIPLVIADDVSIADDVEFAFEEDKILIRKTGLSIEPTVSSEWLYVGDKVGFFGAHKNFGSTVEVIPCDKAIAIVVKSGAIALMPDAEKPSDVIVMAANMEHDAYPTPYVNEIKWMDVDNLMTLCRYFGDMTSSFPKDYMYQLVITGTGGNLKQVAVSKVGISDISYGAIAVKKARENDLELKRKINSAMKMVNSDTARIEKPSINVPEVSSDYDSSDYDEY